MYSMSIDRSSNLRLLQFIANNGKSEELVRWQNFPSSASPFLKDAKRKKEKYKQNSNICRVKNLHSEERQLFS